LGNLRNHQKLFKQTNKQKDMFNKKGLIRNLLMFAGFIVGVVLLILLIKYNWDVKKVFEIVGSYINK